MITSKILVIASLEMSWAVDCICIFTLHSPQWTCPARMSFFSEPTYTLEPCNSPKQHFFCYFIVWKIFSFTFLNLKISNSFTCTLLSLHYLRMYRDLSNSLWPSLLQAEKSTMFNLLHSEASIVTSFLLQLSWLFLRLHPDLIQLLDLTTVKAGGQI